MPALPPAIVSPEIVADAPWLIWNTPLTSLPVTVSSPAPGPLMRDRDPAAQYQRALRST